MVADRTASLTHGGDAPTPDFYSYRWHPVTSASVDGDFVIVGWSDGLTYRCYKYWLRENAVDAGGVDLATREGLIDPAFHLDELAIGSASVGADGSLQIRWSPESVDATYHPGWLRHVAESKHLPSSWLPEPTAWTAESLTEPPTHDGTNVFTDPEVLRAWGDDLMRYGISRLSNLGTDHDFGLKLAEHLKVAVRDTNFGLAWDVKADITMAGSADTNSTANSNLRLGPHTDLPTRETPPGFQFLHCVVNETEGGFSTMADGMAIAAELEANHPEHYEALCTLKWVFFNRGPGIDHRWSGPLIDHGVDGSPLTFRAFYPVRGFPDMAHQDMPRAYAAMKVFSQLGAQDRFRMAYPFAPGDMVGFDNRRILHGRDAFASGGKRHLRGMYIDQDEVRSFVRVANRTQAAGLDKPELQSQSNRIQQES